MVKYKAVDLFCGVGGLSYGLKRSGIEIVAGVDIDESCRYAYEANNTTFIHKSVSDVSAQELNELYNGSDIKILVGCAPCQTFSKHTLKVLDREKSQKWRLLDDFARKIQEIRPEIVSMENVPQLRKYDVFNDFLTVLRQNGYHVSYGVVYCPDYGVPQKRSRLVLLSSLLGPINLIPKTHLREKYRTVRETIGDLNEISNGDIDSRDILHRCSRLSPINLRRIIQSVPGGKWYDWDEELLVECHKKKTGATYSSVYGRMEWDKPSPTITTQFYAFGTGRFGHPEQNRALSLREGALLQTFPKRYKFIPRNGKVLIRQMGRHIGNAVPVRLGEIIGESIISHIKGFYD
ncbi:MAG: DNA (cytosine-5-)-methyltransferase [Candidatus Omnitrophica bacterium]|jgi:DNA (cytosine-5)-methyltransferase 1|nr:DNA (cytosine-5-)-methyltransferase [Candidatus Omnitrophota bacterium]